MSQLSDFISQAQSGSEMSLESLFPATITIGAANLMGSGGSLQKDFEPQPDGTIIEIIQRRFRIQRQLLTASGITLVEQKTHFSCGGKNYRVGKIFARDTDLCLMFEGKQI